MQGHTKYNEGAHFNAKGYAFVARKVGAERARTGEGERENRRHKSTRNRALVKRSCKGGRWRVVRGHRTRARGRRGSRASGGRGRVGERAGQIGNMAAIERNERRLATFFYSRREIVFDCRFAALF